MPKHLQIAEHLPTAELEARYRQATDPVARSQWQILWLLAGGQSTAQVVAHTGYSERWIRAIAHRYTTDGPAGVGDRRHHNPGAKRLLSVEQEAELDQALEGPAPGAGRWTSAQVAAWMSARLDRPVPPARGWEVLQRLGWTHGRPRPQHAQADPDARADGLQRGGLAEQVRAIAAAHPAARIEVWAGDEHRIGLRPIVRAVWYRRGHRPRAVGRARYQWLYVYAFVHPATGQTYWLLLPTVSVAHFERALAELAAALGVGPAYHIVLVIDRAGGHTSRQLALPAGLSLVFLPAYSPELQPAERLWELSDAPLANRPFADLAELETVQAERCQALHAHPEWVGGPRFGWWPAPLAPLAA